MIPPLRTSVMRHAAATKPSRSAQAVSWLASHSAAANERSRDRVHRSPVPRGVVPAATSPGGALEDANSVVRAKAS